MTTQYKGSALASQTVTPRLSYADIAASSALSALRSAALVLMPARHCDGDVAYVETTETLCQCLAARYMSPRQLSKMVVESLDAAVEEFAAETVKS